MISTALWVLAALGVAALAARWIGRRGLAALEGELGARPKVRPVEIVHTLTGIPLRQLLLTMQRAAHGRPAIVPMQPPLRRSWLEEVRFDPATLHPPARSPSPPTRLATVLGPRAKRPLVLEFPVVLAGMGWGLAVSSAVRQALAEASTQAGIALSSGEGPVLALERAVAHRWIWQWSRATWRRPPAAARVADMIELQVGQASEGGIRITRSRRSLNSPNRRRLPSPGPLRIRAGLPVPLATRVRRARLAGGGCPVAVKIPASHHVESDVARLVALGVDVVTLDGAGAGTSGSPAVLADHQAVPVAVGVARAHRWLVRQGLRDRVSLLASGHVHGAADIGKLLALGADAVAVGSVALVALMHGQATRLLPALGPTGLVFDLPAGRPRKFDRDLGAERLTAWLEATRAELALLCQSLGVRGVGALAPRHLVADTVEAQRALGVSWYGQSGDDVGAAWCAWTRDALGELRRGLAVWSRLLLLLERGVPERAPAPSRSG